MGRTRGLVIWHVGSVSAGHIETKDSELRLTLALHAISGSATN